MKTGQKRMIHTSVWDSAQFSKLSVGARLTYIGTISLGDDDGRLKGSPALIRSQIFPYDDDVKVTDVAKWLEEIQDQKLIVRYEIDGVDYFFHPKWENYQQLREDRRRESNIPAPDFTFSPMTTNRQPNGGRAGDKTPLKISKDKINKGNKDTVEPDHAFVSFWDRYPKKVGKKAAWKSWNRISFTPELIARIMASVDAFKASEQWSKDGGRYIPHAATWLNGERWEDEMKPSRPTNKKYENATSKAVRA